MYDAESRLVKALPKMAKAATSEPLKEALEAHLEETRGHVTAIEEVFECFDLEAKGETCEATAGLIEEAGEIIDAFRGSPAINAALICAAQKIEHYEIASYGCLHEWATLLGNNEAVDLLQEILEEEKNANNTLTEIARANCNDQALLKGVKGNPKTPSSKPAATAGAH